MKKYCISDYIRFADLHAQALESNVQNLNTMPSITANYLKNPKPITESCLLDAAVLRFTALQNMIGSKIFPIVIELLQENDKSLLDRLHTLEKMEYIANVNWWIELRNLRNKLAENYHDDYESIANDFNQLMIQSKELLVFWTNFKKKIAPLIKQ